MSRFVAIGLFAEGTSDFRFLLTLLAREASDIIAHFGTQAVVLSEPPVLPLDGRTTEQRTKVACDNRTNVDIFAVHADASRTGRDTVERLVVFDLRESTAENCGLAAERIVGLLPAREMEAWALCDADAIAQACGLEAWPSSRGFPWGDTPIERIEDPKRALDDAVAALTKRRRGRRSIAAAAYLDRIGETARLERLRRLDSYRAFASDLRDAFDSLGLLRAE